MRYTAQYIQDTNFAQFMNKYLAQHGTDGYLYLPFVSDQQTLEACRALLSFISMSNEYFDSNAKMLLNYVWSSKFVSTMDSVQTPEVKITTNSATDKLPHMDVIEKLQKIIDRDLSKTNLSLCEKEIHESGLTYLYNIGCALGINDEFFRQEYSIAMGQKNANDKIVSQEVQNQSEQLREIKKNTLAHQKFALPYRELTDKQIAVVELEFKKLEEYSDAALAPNIRDMQKQFAMLRDALIDLNPDRLKSILHNITKSVKWNHRSQELLPGGLCTHILSLAEVTLNNFNKPQLGSEVRREMVQNYALPKEIAGYFCKVCGEQIADADNQEGARPAPGQRVQELQVEDPVYMMVWKEAMNACITYIRFATPMSIKPLVNSIAKSVRSALVEEEAVLYRVKSNTRDTIKDILQLYAATYIYAALSVIVINNPEKILFGKETMQRKTGGRVKLRYVGGKTTQDAKLYERFVLSTALKLLCATKDNLIKRIKGMSVDVLKQIFIRKAYAWALKHTKMTISSPKPSVTQITAQGFDFKNTSARMQAKIQHDSLLKYIAVAQQYGKARIDTLTLVDIYGKSPHDLEQLMRKGHSIHEFVSDIKSVLPVEQYNARSTLFCFDPEIIKSYPEYQLQSYRLAIEYSKQRIYALEFVPQHTQLKEFRESFAQLFDIEDKIESEIRFNSKRIYIRIPVRYAIKDKLNDFRPHRIIWSRHYCPTGEFHTVGNYYYSDSNGKNARDIKRDEIVGWLSSNDEAKLKEYAGLHITDARCKRCNALFYNAAPDDELEQRLRKRFVKASEIFAFYQYFESRCPVGDLHEFSSNECTKCKFKPEYGKVIQEEYYERYKKQFAAIEEEKNALLQEKLDFVSEQTAAAEKWKSVYKAPAYAAYQYSMKNIARLSSVLNVPYNLLVNLGLSEGLRYADLDKSRIDPSKTLERESPQYHVQASKVKGYIFKTLRALHTWANQDRIYEAQHRFKELTAAMQTDYKPIRDNLKQSVTWEQFSAQDQKNRFTLHPMDYANQLLEYWAGIILQCIDTAGEKYNKSAIVLANYLVRSILDDEKFKSKPDPFVNQKRQDPQDEKDIDDNMSDASEELRDESDVDPLDDGALDEGYDVENVEDVWETE